MSITPDSVRELLHSEDYGDRLRAVNQLRELDLAAAFDLAQLAANDGNARVRYAAISQLASLGQQDLTTVEPLLRRALTNDPEPDVQAAAADAIGGLQLRSAYADLAAVYHSTGEWLVQFSIIAALGELGETSATLPLIESLETDRNVDVRVRAARALGRLGGEEVVLPLVYALSDTNSQVCMTAADALVEIGPIAVRPLITSLKHERVNVRCDATRALGELGDAQF
jgi:HEAT repeat protein